MTKTRPSQRVLATATSTVSRYRLRADGSLDHRFTRGGAWTFDGRVPTTADANEADMLAWFTAWAERNGLEVASS